MTRREVWVYLGCLGLAPLAKAWEFVYFRSQVSPDLTLPIACAAGWLCDVPAAVLAGFSTGLIADAFTGRLIGLSSMTLTVAAFISSWAKRFISPDMPFSRSMAALISSGAADLAAYWVLKASGISIDTDYFFKSILPANVLWSFILVVPFDGLLRGISLAFSRLWPDEAKRKAGGFPYEPNA